MFRPGVPTAHEPLHYVYTGTVPAGLLRSSATRRYDPAMTDQEPGPYVPQRAARRLGVSASIVVAVLVLGLSLGVALGSVLSARSRTTLYDQDVVTSVVDAVGPAVFEVVVTGRGRGLFGGTPTSRNVRSPGTRSRRAVLLPTGYPPSTTPDSSPWSTRPTTCSTWSRSSAWR